MVNDHGQMTSNNVDFMIKLFKEYSNYQFKIKLPNDYNLQNSQNIEIAAGFIEQQKILCKLLYLDLFCRGVRIPSSDFRYF
nr:unnamed protein product [Meloidogyne enterolobii]